MAQPYLELEHTQYILLKKLKDKEQINSNKTFVIDSISSDTLAIKVFESVPLQRYPLIEDSYTENQVIDQLSKILLEDLTRSQPADSFKMIDFIVQGERKIVFTTDSTIEKLSFLNSRLQGSYSKFNSDGEMLVSGFYSHGAPDSTWSYFNTAKELVKKEVFENRELVSRSIYDSTQVKTASFLARRDKFKVLYAILVLMGVLVLSLIYWIYLKRHKLNSGYDFSCLFILIYPLVVSALAFIILLNIPYFTFTAFFPLNGILNLLIYFISSLLVYILLLNISALRVKEFYIQYMLINALMLCMYEVGNFISELENEVLIVDFLF